MDNTTIIVIAAVAVVILLLILWMAMRKKRTDALRDQYGDEYDRTVEDRGSTDKAERDLIEREKRVHQFDIRPLDASERERFTGEWTETKALFVDAPNEAVLRADRLLTNVMQTRGFPMADFDRRYEDLTVDYGDVARHYRAGHEIADRQHDASTEDLRQALNHYEKLFAEMVSGGKIDRDGDGIDDRAETRRVDRDGDGVDDRAEARRIDRDGDGVDDRVEAAPASERPHTTKSLLG